MLVSEIYRKLINAADDASFSLDETQSTDLFSRAQEFYFNGLQDRWGTSLDNDTELSPLIIKTSVTPASNIILYSALTEYSRLGFLRPTYITGGQTYSFPSKPIAENEKYSTYSTGTVRYPRHYLTDTGIVLQPDNTPTTVELTYVRNPYAVDFDSPTDDIPYTEINVQKIIDQCLTLLGQQNRELDYSQAVQQQSVFDSKQPPL